MKGIAAYALVFGWVKEGWSQSEVGSEGMSDHSSPRWKDPGQIWGGVKPCWKLGKSECGLCLSFNVSMLLKAQLKGSAQIKPWDLLFSEMIWWSMAKKKKTDII